MVTLWIFDQEIRRIHTPNAVKILAKGSVHADEEFRIVVGYIEDITRDFLQQFDMPDAVSERDVLQHVYIKDAFIRHAFLMELPDYLSQQGAFPHTPHPRD